jgi:hypothetical protein
LLLGGGIATLVMDTFNGLASALKLVSPIRHDLIGQLLVAWGRGGFYFESPADVPHVAAAKELGYLFHYAIGIFFFASYQLAFGRQKRRAAGSLALALAFGGATSIVSLLLVYPSMGLGLAGLKVPHAQVLITSVANHLFYGFGIFLGWHAVQRLRLLRGSAWDLADGSVATR